jgi:hypothetical protein
MMNEFCMPGRYRIEMLVKEPWKMAILNLAEVLMAAQAEMPNREITEHRPHTLIRELS